MLRMFPIFVRKAQVAPSVRQGIEDNVLSKLNEMSRVAGEPAPGRGWQSAKDLHHLDEFRGLVACIHDAAESVLEFLKTEDGAFQIDDPVLLGPPTGLAGILGENVRLPYFQASLGLQNRWKPSPIHRSAAPLAVYPQFFHG